MSDLTGPAAPVVVPRIGDVGQLVERLRDAEISGHGPLNTLLREAAAMLEQSAEWRESWKLRAELAESRLASAQADAERYRLRIDAMAKELMELRGSFPAKDHERFYVDADAADDRAREAAGK